MVLGLESVVFQQDLFGNVYGGFGDQSEEISNNTANRGSYDDGYGSSLYDGGGCWAVVEAPAGKRSGRRKRRREKMVKNREEIENQRMTHIAVERNRRKQMNEYLSVLRSMMPSSYTQRGDQASIVGGTINFVKELEQLLQCLEAEKQNFTSNSGHDSANSAAATVNVDVTVIENYANIKMMAENRPKQLLKLVLQLHSLHLLILHINVTTIRPMVLYCFTVKIEDDCKLSTVGEITAAVNEIFGRIHMEKFD